MLDRPAFLAWLSPLATLICPARRIRIEHPGAFYHAWFSALRRAADVTFGWCFLREPQSMGPLVLCTLQFVRLKFIDSWRAICIFAVIICHLAKNRAIDGILQKYGVGFISGYGQTGVFVFFFISGYVVSQTLIVELEKHSTINIQGFYVRRVFRILPPLLLYLSTYLLLGKLRLISFSTSALAASVLYLSNSSLPLLQCDWYTGHTWSLAFEEQFYLAFPLLFAFLQCSRRPPPASFLLAPLILLPAVYPINWIGRMGFIVIYALFLAGYFAASHAAFLYSVLSKAPTILFLTATLLTFAPVAIFHDEWFSKLYKLVYIVSIPCAVLSSGLPGNYFGALFRFSLVSYVGRISYSLYLWQEMLTSDSFSASALWVQPTLLLILLMACCASYEWLEKPLIALGRSVARSRGIQANHVPV